MRMLESGIGELAEKILGGVDQMVNFGLLSCLVSGDALLVTIFCCDVVKIEMLITESDGEMMKENGFSDAASKHKGCELAIC